MRPTRLRDCFLVSLLCCPVISFSATTRRSKCHRNRSAPTLFCTRNLDLLHLRGGQQQDNTRKSALSDAIGITVAEESSPTMGVTALVAPVVSIFRFIGTSYAKALNTRPILTKSITASLIFGLSDYTAQRLEFSNASSKNRRIQTPSEQKKNTAIVSWSRTLTSMAVGFFYFGPTAHVWYDTIFRVFPKTSLVSTLQKAALGQLVFGPSFTCVFFAASLLQSNTFSLHEWWIKIKNDLPGAWVAGLGFWPLVDLISYSCIPPQWIPLFVNMCSFMWTIYLSLIANRKMVDNRI